MINRKELVSRHDPTLHSIELDSPLTVGNGEFAFSADVTGMQTLSNLYSENHMPLCTMSQWGWHITPTGNEKTNYTLADIKHTEFQYANRKVFYPVEKAEGDEEVYNWLRQNPHRANLARIGLCWNGQEISPSDLTNINQKLHLYEGRLESQFCIKAQQCSVTTICDSKSDSIGFEIKSDVTEIMVGVAFPYGSHNMSGSDWQSVDEHKTEVIEDENAIIFKRTMNTTIYYAVLKSNQDIKLNKVKEHHFELSSPETQWAFSIHFTKQENSQSFNYEECLQNSKLYWEDFWKSSGIADFKKSKDKRAKELERRIILSKYLSAIQCCGSLPPQETGLTCNSWHGKFHLEMYLWHCAYLPLWNQSPLLERSLPWYKEILEKAKVNAGKNGFQGVRWPKQVAYDGIDSPSYISPLLVWQQSHIIYMLELAYTQNKSKDFLEEYWEIIKETTNFMCDFMVFDEEKNQYELVAPIIPAQEEHRPQNVKNPTFEIEYWRFSIGLAIKWAERLNQTAQGWRSIFEKIAMPPVEDKLYLAHENCKTTFVEFNRDHPSMLGAFGLIPSERIDPIKMKKTIDKVLECWDFQTMWGWDFAMMAMTATRLGLPELAMDILLMDSPKNEFVTSGNNFQRLRNDLPLYLPGNGSLLLAVGMMLAGYGGEDSPGIPKNGMWEVEFENIVKFPY